MPQSRLKNTAGPRTDWGVSPSKLYGVMAMTTLLTFGALVTGYQLFFSYSVFA